MAEMTAEERVREWSGTTPVQQVFMDGYFKDSSSAATAIFEAMEIMANLVRDRDQAVEQEREECAEIAQIHGDFCFDEADKGGSPDLRERARGAWHIAKKIKARCEQDPA